MSLNIKIENFEGPFDLLLHLIKKNKMDISDVKIYEITNQYLEYIHTMEEMDLEITSEFIVIAATLIEIKSKILLPKYNDDENAVDLDERNPEKELLDKLIQYKKFKSAALFLKEREQGTGRIFSKKPEIIEEKRKTVDLDERNPEKELLDKLIQYKKFKSAALFLKEREQGTGRMFSKKPEIIEEKKKTVDPKDFLEEVTILKLYEIYNNLIAIYRNKINNSNVINREIPIDKFKIEDKMEYLKENIEIGTKVLFSNIINECTSKIEVVVTFLALLELMKLKYIMVVQEQNFKEIYVERTNADEE